MHLEHSAIRSNFIKLPVGIKMFSLFLSDHFTQGLLYKIALQFELSTSILQSIDARLSIQLATDH